MDLLYKNEKALFTISVVLSVLFWVLILVGTVGTILIGVTQFDCQPIDFI